MNYIILYLINIRMKHKAPCLNSFNELKRGFIVKNFKIEKLLGLGGFGKVFSAYKND